MIQAGLQACSFADFFVENPQKTLQRLAECGYKYIETAGNMFDERLHTSTKELRKMMDDAGIVHAAKHHCPLDISKLGEEVELLHTLGGQYLVLATDFYPSMDQLLRNCERFNEAGRILKAEGLTYMMHNHCQELQHFGDKTVLELIAENTDPELLQIEVDIMWAYRGGVNPWDILPKLGKRVRLLHIDDFCKKYGSFWEEVPESTPIDGALFGEKNKDTGMDIGDGKLDIQRSIDAAIAHTAAEYGFIELSTVNTQFQNDLYQAAAYGLSKLKLYNGIICE